MTDFAVSGKPLTQEGLESSLNVMQLNMGGDLGRNNRWRFSG